MRAVWGESHALNLHTFLLITEHEEIERFTTWEHALTNGLYTNWAMSGPQHFREEQQRLRSAVIASPFYVPPDREEIEAALRKGEEIIQRVNALEARKE